MGRRPIYKLAMTTAERKARSRQNLRDSIHAEAHLAGELIAQARREAARIIGATSADDKLLSALDALERISDLVRR